MEGPLLRVLLLLVASRGGCGQYLGQVCYFLAEGTESLLGAFRCPGPLDGADDHFCCGTCSAPFCCASRESALDPIQCSAFGQGGAARDDQRPTPPPREGRINVLWFFIGIFIASLVVWCICHNCNIFIWSRRPCGDRQEEEIELEDRHGSPVPAPEDRRGSPVPAPHPPATFPRDLFPPPAPRSFDDPPPYSVTDSLSYPTLPSMTNAPLRMGPAQTHVAEGGAPDHPCVAEGGAPDRPHRAEGGVPPPAYLDDPPPYSVIDPFPSLTLPCSETNTCRMGPPQPSGAEGGAPAEPCGAEGGAPAEPCGAEGGAPAEPCGAEGGTSGM